MNNPATLHLQNAGDAARQVASELKAGAVEGALAASDTAAREAARLRERTHDWWQRQTDLARSAAGMVKDEAQVLGDQTRQYVRDEPMKSLLWAALAGALLAGLAWAGSRRGR
jgi:ElaB/YqjD/DUF883 family membrane-anchored ribosome-binding protein